MHVIRPSASPYSSPIIIVEKANAELRFWIDYRQLNSQTASESTTLPPITHLLQDIGEEKIFSTIDLKKGYWQVPLEEGSKNYTAFHTLDGPCYEFNVMPFGLKNAPGSFQRMMNEVLVGYLDIFCKVYLDDIIIYSNTFEEHKDHLRTVLERFRTHELWCSVK